MAARSKPPRFSLRSRIALALGGFSAAFTIALCLLFGHLLEQRMQAQANQALSQTVHSAQLLLSHELAIQLARTQELANSRQLWSQGLNSPQVQDTLQRLQRINPYNVWAGVADASGRLVSSTLGALHGLNASQRLWFQRAQNGPFIGEVTATPELQALLPPRPGNHPLRLLDFAAPIRSKDGQILGILAMHSDWEWVRATLEGLLMPRKNAEQLGLAPHSLFIFDHTGQMLYAPHGKLWPFVANEQTLPLQPHGLQPSTQVAHWSDSAEPYLNAMIYLPLPTLPEDKGWWVVARVPAEIAWADAQRARYMGLVLGLLSGLLAAWVAWILARHLTGDLKTLAQASQQLLQHHCPQSMPLLYSNKEVFHLSQALRHMTQQLLQSYENMHAQVKARTHELQQANEALQRLAYTDPLTKILNRRGFERQAQPLLHLAQRHRRELSVIALDVDHFKRINDTHGHDVGDSVLQQIAQLLLARLRSSDLLARFGGEEFIILLPDTCAADALQLAKDLLQQIAQTPFAPVNAVTLSAGISSLMPPQSVQEDLRHLILRADQALYLAKQRGRNRAVMQKMP